MLTGILEVTTHGVKEMFGLFTSCSLSYMYDCVIASCKHSAGMASRDPLTYDSFSIVKQWCGTRGLS